MRYALALLALTTPLVAQDTDGPGGQPDKPFDAGQAERNKETAASLFYRAFWIEQAKRKGDEAEKLYEAVIKKYADAPEAPRAYIALIRLRAARGVEVADLVRSLEEGYPKSVKEIERARKLAARLRSDFDPTKKADDTPLLFKLKDIYSDLYTSGAIRPEDRDFLSDVGAAGHPMLARVLRSSSSAAVKTATSLLVHQHTKEANTVVSAALRDPTILYRMTIIDQLRLARAYDPDLMKTLREIWPQASRSLRRRIAQTWANGTWSRSPSIAQCYGYLALAVGDEDAEVRKAATMLTDATAHVLRPESYVAAVIPHCLKGDPAMQSVWQWLPWQLPHKKLAPRIVDALGRYDGPLSYHNQASNQTIAEEDAVAMARMVIARYASARASPVKHDGTPSFATLAARSSGVAAGLMLDASLRLNRVELAWACSGGMAEMKRYPPAVDKFIPDAANLRGRAIKQSYDKDLVRRKAGEAVLGTLGLRAVDLAVVIREAKAHPEHGLSRVALQAAFLSELGAERAAQLIPAAASGQIDYLLKSGQSVWIDAWKRKTTSEIEKDFGEPFWAAMLARFEPSSTYWSLVYQLPRESPMLAHLVAGWVLERREKEFEWTVPGKTPARSRPGKQLLSRSEIRNAFDSPKLRGRLFRLAADERQEIGQFALRIAQQERGDSALLACRGALDSPWDDVVRGGLDLLPSRGAAGAAILAEYLQRPKLRDDLKRKALQEFAGSHAKDQLPFIRKCLDERCDGYEASVMWDLAFEYDRDATVDRALVEVFGQGSDRFCSAALRVLTKASDARRIPVFRKVLRESKDTDRVHMVLRTVADQYLIELGPEVLLHLRNPDNGIRNTATKAIERLKFYAEAKKLFDKEK